MVPALARAVCAAILLSFNLARAAAETASPWVAGQIAQARLVSAGGLATAGYAAGVEIKLASGAHTYWRQAGDAGAPPVFQFEESTNLADAEVRYPAPERFDEAGLTAFGYRDRVIFPIFITPKDPARPVALALDLRYAACDKLCVPLQAKLRLTLEPAAALTDEAASIAAFAARAPRAGGPALHATPDGAGEWRVEADAALPASADLFVDPPAGWWFDAKRAGEGFALTLAQTPADAPATLDLPVTLVIGEQAFASSLRLDQRR